MSESDDSPHLSRGSSGHSGQSNSEVWSSSISQFEERQANLLASNRATACNTFLTEVEVKRLPKMSLSCSNMPPTNLESLDKYVQLCFRGWSSPWVFVDRPAAVFKADTVAPITSLPTLQFEAEMRQDERLASVSVLNRSLMTRPQMRTPLPDPLASKFTALYNPQWDWSRGVAFALAERNFSRIGDPNASKVFQKPESTQFLVEPADVVLAAGGIEPLFCSLALYHVNLKIKISETFHFACDASGHLEAVRAVVGPDMQGDILAEQACVFSVSSPSKYVHLVLTVQRVLQGDEEKTADPYLAVGSEGGLAVGTVRLPWQNANRKLNKIRDQAHLVCSRLGKSLQQFAFASLPVFDNDGRFILSDSAFSTLFLHPPGLDICDAILQGTSTKRLKQVAGQCAVSVRRISAKDGAIANRLDVSLSPYMKSGEGSFSSVAKPGVYLRDIFDLMPVPKPLPFMSYVGTIFLSPMSLTLPFLERRKSIIVRLELRQSDDDAVTVPLKSLFSSTGAVQRILTDTAHASVIFNSKSPTWQFEELRVHLPSRLTEKHHLMVFFSEVDVQAVRKSATSSSSELLIGASVIPLVNSSGALVDSSGQGVTLSLPVISCTQPLPRGYLALAEQGTLPLLENGKELFKVAVRGFSSTLSSNPSVATIMRGYRLNLESSEALSSSLKDLADVNVDFLIPHFPSLCYVLIQLLDVKSEIALQAFEALLTLMARTHSVDKRPTDMRSGMVHQFIEFMFEPLDPRVYLMVMTQFITFLIVVKKKSTAGASGLSLLFSTSWMVFDLMFKAMLLSTKTELLSTMTTERTRQFASETPRLLKRLFAEMRSIIFASLADPARSQGCSSLNINMAMFVSDLICIYDRGLICDLLIQHFDEFNAQIAAKKAQSAAKESATLTLMMLDFYKLMSDHESFVPLNLPKRIDISKDTVATLGEAIEDKHPLIARLVHVVISELIDNSRFGPRCLSLSVLVNLITKIDRTDRYAAAEDRHRIAVMFFPLILNLIRSWKEIEAWRRDSADLDKTRSAVDDISVNPSRIYERQELGCAVVWILKNLEESWFGKWRLANPSVVFSGLLPLLEDLLQVFCREKGLMNFSTPFCSTSSNIDALMDINKFSAAACLKLRTRLGVRGVTAQQSVDPTVDEAEETTKRAKHLSNAIVLCVVSVLESTMSDKKETIQDVTHALSVASVFQSLLETDFSAEAAPFVFDALYRFVDLQGGGLFRHELKNETARFISSAMRMCSFSCPQIRGEAAAFVYTLILRNSKFISSFEVVKNSAILACSRLAEENKEFGGAALKNALNAISEYALQDYYVPSTDLAEGGDSRDDEDSSATSGRERERLGFVKEVQEFCRALSKIVRDTKEIVGSRGSSDVEMVAEQYYRISEGYRNSSELRLEWLEKLAQFHAKNGDFAEAALAMTHVLALLADFLNNCTDVRVDVSSLRKIHPSIAEFYSDESSSAESPSFSLRHFKFVAKAVIKFFDQAELYEMAALVFKILLPIAHSEGAFRDLTNAHTQLESFFSKLALNDTNRLLGRYFRVGFYGAVFGAQLDGQEFVYKEKLLTHLFSLKERLVAHFSELVGGEARLEVLEHGGIVESSSLDPNKGYLQITALRPVFNDDEIDQRRSFISQNTLLHSFAYEVPFQRSGKVGQASAADQFIRRTILTTDAVFPFLLKRIPVRSRREVVVPPIEIAIEMMQNRIEKLLSEVARTPPDSKTLQQVLQGSVLTTVNRGTVEYLEIFLSNPGDYGKMQIRMLKSKFKGFFSAAEQGLKLNKKIIDSNQQEFQTEMENGFKELCKLAEPLIRDDEEEEETSAPSSPKTHSAAVSPRSPRLSSSPRASPKLNRRRSVVERKTSSKSSSRQTSPREKEEGGVTAGSPETPPSTLQAKKSVHRLSVDRPRRSSSSAVVGNEGPGKTKPARTSSTTALKKSSE